MSRLPSLGDRGSVIVVLMHDYHGSAVAVVHILAGGIFGVKGTRRQRFRRPLLGSLAGSQQGSFGEPLADRGVGDVSWSKSMCSDRVLPILITYIVQRQQASGVRRGRGGTRAVARR